MDGINIHGRLLYLIHVPVTTQIYVWPSNVHCPINYAVNDDVRWNPHLISCVLFQADKQKSNKSFSELDSQPEQQDLSKL